MLGMIRALGTIFAGLLGLAFGSFLNVCLSRWPMGESVVQPRSHCRHCSHTLGWWENLPLLSWLALRGRCRTCRAWIGWRYPLVEATVGALWAATWVSNFNLCSQYPEFLHEYFLQGCGTAIFFWLLTGLAALDAENLWLPDWLTLPGAALGLACFCLRAWASSVAVSAQYGFPCPSRIFFRLASQRLAELVAGAALILLIRWIYWLIRKREGMGLGDAKLMALLAAWLGLPGALLAFGVGILLGSVVALLPLAARSRRELGESWAASKLPLGSFLCIGGMVSSLWGKWMIAVYLRWAGI